MKSSTIRKKYIDFFVKRGHKVIPSAPLVPENDPTTLFNSSGMQPLAPYLLGEPHPLGKRLVNSQKAIRLQDIDEVGDNRHTTFFEMLGNWSLGDYFKKEQLPWIWEFLTKELGLNAERLYVTVFSGEAGSGSAREGNSLIPKDTESIEIWQEIFSGIGIDAKVVESAQIASPNEADRPARNATHSVAGGRIFTYPASKNWWSRSGEPEKMPAGEPGGPDSEVFYDLGPELKYHENSPWKNEQCHPNCDCGRYLEIANSVFMQYVKKEAGTLEELKQKNVDFGGGLERLTAASENTPDVFQTDLFMPIIRIVEQKSGKNYGQDAEGTRAMRIISDHIKGAVMMMADGVIPSNKLQGYVLRRLLRRSLLYGLRLGLKSNGEYLSQLVEPVAEIYREPYPEVSAKLTEIKTVIEEETQRFGKSLERGMKQFESYTLDQLNALNAFNLYQSFGFPYEMSVELFKQKGKLLDRQEFEKIQLGHKKLSQTTAGKMFKGGLADHSEKTIRLHTAHHLLLAALQKIVDLNIKQRGSNITAERLRIDFNLGRGLTQEEKEKVEKWVNQKIKEDVKVIRHDMERTDAEKIGAQMEFGKKYPEKVSVYFVDLKAGVDPKNAKSNDYFSAEFCGGPHVDRTRVIGYFKITKEEALGSGIRRIYAEAKL